MRKHVWILMVFLFGVSVSGFGQIKVNSAGKTFFGSGTGTTSYGTINLMTDGAANGISFTGTSANRFGIFKYNNQLYLSPANNYTKGLKVGSDGGITMARTELADITTASVLTLYTTSERAIKMYGNYASGGQDLIQAVIYNHSTNSGYSIYLSANGTTERNFYATAGGTVYAKSGYIQSSDAGNKIEIQNLENALDKISSLSAISFYYEGEQEAKKKSLATLTPRPVKILSSKGDDELAIDITPETITQMRNEVARKRIGLIAQEVEKVVPEVVRTMEDGKKGIMYSDLVSLLIEGIKELSQIVEEQKLNILDLEEKVNLIEETIYLERKQIVNDEKILLRIFLPIILNPI